MFTCIILILNVFFLCFLFGDMLDFLFYGKSHITSFIDNVFKWWNDGKK